MATGEDKPNGRDAQRQETRKRVYAAAVAEFRRVGRAAADVSVIVKEAGVARGTFYFHFPTKEHVLAELERHEEARLVAQLSKFLTELQARCGPTPTWPAVENPRDGPAAERPAAEGPAGAPAGQAFLPAALGEVVRLLTAMERRVG